MTESVDVLVIEDDPAIGRLLSRLLAKLPVSYALATTPHEALRVLAERPARLLLVDGQLGAERAEPFVGRFREAAPGARVVSISGVLADDAHHDWAPYDGVAGKPVLLTDLQTLLARWLPPA